jgi:hypothetical protein
MLRVAKLLKNYLALNPNISLENELFVQGLMNTTYHQGYLGYPRSWPAPYAIINYTSIA